MNGGVTPERVTVDLKMSTLRPLHAKWVISFYDFMKNNHTIVANSWKRFKIKPEKEKKGKIHFCGRYYI